MSITYIKLQVKPVWKPKKIVYNIECYGELFSSIAPKQRRKFPIILFEIGKITIFFLPISNSVHGKKK
jgi:hypothetical protein